MSQAGEGGAAVEVCWTVEEPRLAEGRVQEAVAAALEEGGRPGLELSIVFVGAEELRRLHEERLGDPEPTDVMAFDLGDEGPGPAGELYVSVDRAREVAGELGVPTERELLLYVVHGVLHLCGHDDHDPTAAQSMRAAEGRVLERIGQPRDPQRHA